MRIREDIEAQLGDYKECDVLISREESEFIMHYTWPNTWPRIEGSCDTNLDCPEGCVCVNGNCSPL